MNRTINLSQYQKSKLDISGPRFQELDGIIFDLETFSYYEEGCDAYLNAPVDILNIMNKLKAEIEENINKKLEGLKEEIVEALTPRGANKNDDYRRW